jgi:hypothetical protein
MVKALWSACESTIFVEYRLISLILRLAFIHARQEIAQVSAFSKFPASVADWLAPH